MKYSLSPWEIPPALPSGSGYILLYIPSLVPDSVLLSKHSGMKLFTFLLEFNKYDNAFNNATVQSEIGGRSWWRESQIIFLKVSAAVLVSSSSSSSSSSAYHDFTSFGKVCWPLAAESLVSYTISWDQHRQVSWSRIFTKWWLEFRIHFGSGWNLEFCLCARCRRGQEGRGRGERHLIRPKVENI